MEGGNFCDWNGTKNISHDSLYRANNNKNMTAQPLVWKSNI